MCSVLGQIDSTGSPDTKARIEKALLLDGAEAASALMDPIASALGWVERTERVAVLHAVDALIRAGGDPTPALSALAQSLGDSRTVQAACAALHRAALSGYSIAPVREHLSKAAGQDSAVRAVQRLEALQRRGLHAELRRLSAIYKQVPVANLHVAIGLLEESLLSDVDDEVSGARLALENAECARSDLYRCWVALLPVLHRHLHAPHRERRERAAAALGQVKLAISQSTELKESEARERVLPLLHPALDGLTALLGGEEAERRIGARAIEVFAEIGCSLAEFRSRIEVALRDEQIEVRSACSRALSMALQRAGDETPLPPGRSHRRSYALSDTPLGDGRKARCPNCDALEAVVIYELRDRGNTWDDTTIERKCSSCQIYSLEHFGL